MRHDTIVDDLRRLRERIGRAHGFDVDRIAAAIREHERVRAATGGVPRTRRVERDAVHTEQREVMRW